MQQKIRFGFGLCDLEHEFWHALGSCDNMIYWSNKIGEDEVEVEDYERIMRLVKLTFLWLYEDIMKKIKIWRKWWAIFKKIWIEERRRKREKKNGVMREERREIRFFFFFFRFSNYLSFFIFLNSTYTRVAF